MDLLFEALFSKQLLCICQAFAERIEEELQQYSPSDRDDVVILFSAHSLPMKVQRFFLLSLNCISYMFLFGCQCTIYVCITVSNVVFMAAGSPCVGQGQPFPPCQFASSSFALFYFSHFPFLIRFTYFLLLFLPSLFLPEQSHYHVHSGGRRRRPNLGLDCSV